MELVLYVRNVSNQSLSFKCAMFPSNQYNPPMVTDAEGKHIEFHLVFGSGLIPTTSQTIAPGGILLINNPHFMILAQKPDNRDFGPALVAGPGKYKLTFVETLQQEGAAFSNLILITGPLEFTLTGDARNR